MNDLINKELNNEDIKELYLITNNIDIDLSKTNIKKHSNTILKKNTIFTTLQSINNDIFITHISNYKNNIKTYSETTIQYQNTSKISLNVNNQNDIIYLKGYIIDNNNLYTFSINKDNSVTIKLYDYPEFKKQTNSNPTNRKYLNNLSLDKITINPIQVKETILENDLSPFELLNYIFLNQDIITNLFNNKIK